MDAENLSPDDTITPTIKQPPTPPRRSLVLRDWPQMLGVLLLVTLATGVSVAYIDLPLAQFVKAAFSQGPSHTLVTAKFPDGLDIFVAAVTIASWIGYIILRRRNPMKRLVCLLQVIGTATPFAYTAKDLLKSVFGRVDTRYWLNHPYHFVFRWFHSSSNYFGFPSGHMAIACALVFAVMHYYPRLKPWGWAAMVLLGAALIATEYHFLGDVLAGAYIGYLAFVAARELPGAAAWKNSPALWRQQPPDS
jgi:membrane-associated phospholipid phosphatase